MENNENPSGSFHEVTHFSHRRGLSRTELLLIAALVAVVALGVVVSGHFP